MNRGMSERRSWKHSNCGAIYPDCNIATHSISIQLARQRFCWQTIRIKIYVTSAITNLRFTAFAEGSEFNTQRSILFCLIKMRCLFDVTVSKIYRFKFCIFHLFLIACTCIKDKVYDRSKNNSDKKNSRPNFHENFGI